MRTTARILVVDDSLYMRSTLGRILQEAGHEVVEAETGERALQEYATARPDLVTLDLVMPGLGGLETLRRLRAAAPESKVVVVSAVDQRAHAEEARALGAVDYVVKPFDPPAVVRAVRSALG